EWNMPQDKTKGAETKANDDKNVDETSTQNVDNPLGDVKDFDKPFTRADMIKLMEEKDKFNNCNSVELTGTVIESYFYPKEPKPMLDKDTKEPLKDENGVVRTFPQKHIVKISFNGGEYEFDVPKSLTTPIDVGSVYKFVGRMSLVKEFGSTIVKPVFYRAETGDFKGF
ncbi:hypothetical protein AWC38_SpisGene25428, partial [Stylophora pistillata]